MNDLDTLDPWTELSRAGEVPPASEQSLLDARAAVRRAATTETLRAKVVRARRRRVRLALTAGVIAASIAVGAVRITVGDHELAPSPAAAAVLERAARAAMTEDSLVVGPGQYLRITLVEQSWGASYGSERDRVLTGKDGKPATTEERRTRTIWIPHDIDQDWVIRDGSKVLRYGTSDPAYHYGGEPTETWSEPSWSKHGDRYIKTYDPDWYADLPRDPQALIAAISDSESGREGSGLAYDFEEVYSEVLRSGMAPPEVRAALFTGLAETPGMVVEHDVTTLDGRSGVALGAADSNWRMIFDATTGRYLGERATDPSFPDVTGLDADKTTWLSSVTSTVVDHAPSAEPAR